ncbi:MAG: type II secretion system F family protein [Patescibacteria group bacterium]|nr:type II secretion system F family protein [Patescibacteria group bacterium]
MAIFQYSARNEYGEKVSGKVEARTRDQAASVLMSRDLLVISIKSSNSSSLAMLEEMLLGVKEDDLVNFTRQLATMISSGLSLATALAILQDQSKPAMGKLVTKILKDIEGGNTFASALKNYPDIFSRVYVQLVRAGEAGGVLEEVLERLAVTLEKKKDFRAKTKGAMIYPIIVVIAMVLVGAVMMIFVVPKLTQMYQDFDANLPFATRALIVISNFMAKFWYILALVVAVLVVVIKQWSKTELGEKKLDEVIMKVPILGQLHMKLVLTEFSRTLSLLLGSGVSLLESLEIVSQALDSAVIRSVINDARDEVEKGVPLSQALSAYEILPTILPQMVSVGEETGRIDEILLKLSEYYERESEYEVKNLTTIMEPLIMLVLGIGVGFMVISIIMPIYNLTSQF